MHRSTAGHNPYNLFILTRVYSKNFPTSYLRTIEHMAMFVVKSIHIQINSQVMDLSIGHRFKPCAMVQRICTYMACLQTKHNIKFMLQMK